MFRQKPAWHEANIWFQILKWNFYLWGTSAYTRQPVTPNPSETLRQSLHHNLMCTFLEMYVHSVCGVACDDCDWSVWLEAFLFTFSSATIFSNEERREKTTYLNLQISIGTACTRVNADNGVRHEAAAQIQQSRN